MAIEHLMVAAPLIETEQGRAYAPLPPHIIIFPWFEMPSENFEGFDGALGRIIENASQPSLRPRISGRGIDITDGNNLHSAIARAVCQNGGDFDPNYTGKHWHPHILDKNGYELLEDGILLSELTVFSRHVVEKKIAKTVVAKTVYKWESVSV